MDQNKLLNIQRQAVQNTAELNDYIKGLNSWCKDIKKKDNAFMDMKPKNKGMMVPPVRNSKAIKESKAKKEPVKRISGFDFKAWDKLDVDKMMKEIDEEEEECDELNKNEKAVKLEKDLLKLSVEEKEKGNKHFKAGKYELALKSYTLAMQYDPSNAILPSNRATTYFKMKKWVECEADCTLSLSLDSGFVKPYFRRGMARVHMGKVSSAQKDFTDVLKLEPENKGAAAELKKLNDLNTKKSENIEPSAKLPLFGSTWTKGQKINAVERSYQRRSKRPLRRVKVQEIGVSLNKNPKNNFEKSSGDAKVGFKAPLIKEISEDEEPQINKPEESQTAESSIKSRSLKTKSMAEDKHQKHINAPKQPDITVPELAKISAQFIADFNKLSERSAEKAFEYISKIVPSNLKKHVKKNFDAHFFENVLAAVLPFTKEKSEFVYNLLLEASKVDRFKLVVLMLNSTSQKNIKAIFDDLKESISDERLKELYKLYEL